ncbi:lytic transglycosylase domain protein [Geotalea daltonii FRC-32]|uniref:Lytic transglycosylase domain protein n=1 Tax=Geotalea daltonii (strain DSM 22248 / JCM 15807 / FRC-32) TaxID=316067 RepID=B9M5H6_GEODF|nr:tetratricopeptide repeat protein [Geotalea daltonii]ACM21735.1 lytic transglycosylase domain protein [Geotalea daltonii FRC-32]
MLFRSLTALALIILFSISASGTTLFPLPDEALQEASKHFRDKDYGPARESALKAPQSGIRDFILGMAAIKLEQWQEAISYLGYAAHNFPLLGDYALYNQATAFSRQDKHPEALASLGKMLKVYPESPINRAAIYLKGNELYASGNFIDALKTYTDFIERYPQGADSLTALYRSALCREQLGDPAAAASILRSIPINYPASSLTPKASLDLERLAQTGIKIEPLSTNEIFRQGTILFDLGKYAQAIKTFDSVLQKSSNPEINVRFQFKKAQALFKSRHYKDAEQLFTALGKVNSGKVLNGEIRFWLARTLAKNGKEDEAVSAYLLLADTWPKAALADDALLEAAQIRKSQKKTDEAQQLLQRSLFLYPESGLKKSLLWEIAWERYQAKDYKAASDWFGKLAGYENARDRALYWRGKSLAAAGDQEGAKASFSQLMTEFPLGYYALTHAKEAGIASTETTLPPVDLTEALPVPAGFERVKALITLGFYDEAQKELSGQKKPKMQQGIARLYLEMGNYNAVVHLFKKEPLSRLDKESALAWGLNYPLAFRDYVTKNAGDSNLPESLVYAIIRAESTYSPTALSPVGAVGLMQLMPATASAVARGKLDRNSLTVPAVNIRFGSKHLKDLLDYHNGDLVKVIAAYNAGSGNVGKWEKRLGDMPRDQFIENIPFGETREYVKKVLAGMELYQRFYGLDRKPVEKAATPAEKTAAVQSELQPAQ